MYLDKFQGHKYKRVTIIVVEYIFGTNKEQHKPNVKEKKKTVLKKS